MQNLTSHLPPVVLILIMVVAFIIGYALVSFIIGKLKLPPPPTFEPKPDAAALPGPAEDVAPAPEPEKGLLRSKKPRPM